MCYSGSCPYERSDGSCGGRPKGALRVKPGCMEDEDLESYNESVSDAAILEYDLAHGGF